MSPTLDIGPNDDGTIDEIVVRGDALVHLEQMGDDSYYLGIYDPTDDDRYVMFTIRRKGKAVTVTEYERGDKPWPTGRTG